VLQIGKAKDLSAPLRTFSYTIFWTMLQWKRTRVLFSKPYFSEDTACAVLFRGRVSVKDQNLVFAAVSKKNHYFLYWNSCEGPLIFGDEIFGFIGH
jgi:hypothetical protein